MTELYDGNGNHVGSTGGGGEVVFLAFFVGIGYAILKFFSWGWGEITNWHSLDTPYNYIGAFYNYVIAMPIKVGVDLEHWLSLQKFTQYPNLNTTISVFGVIVYIVVIVFIIRSLMSILRYFSYDAKVFWYMLIAPSAVGGGWFLSLELFQWLTATA